MRKRHQPKLESASGVMLQLETGELVPASETGLKKGKSRGGQVRMNYQCFFQRHAMQGQGANLLWIFCYGGNINSEGCGNTASVFECMNM